MTSIPGLTELEDIRKHIAQLEKERLDLGESEVVFEILLDSILDVPRQLQLMIDGVVAAQKFIPMPEEGWDQFVRDIEYTNQKHGWNLQVPKMEG